jgi:hypothetical protein
VNAAGADSPAPQSAVQTQYHSQRGPQYHGGAAAFRRPSAPEGEISEINLLNPPPLISHNSYSHFTNRSAATPLPSDVGTSSPIERSIDTQIQRSNDDTRKMLGVGAVLGLIYVLFLATWFWTTRFLLRPEGSART